MNESTRREFFKSAAAALAASQFGSTVLAAQEESPQGLPVRPLGSTGEKVTIIGLGGYNIGNPEQRELLDNSKAKAAGGQIEQYKIGDWGCDWFHNQTGQGAKS